MRCTSTSSRAASASSARSCSKTAAPRRSTTPSACTRCTRSARCSTIPASRSSRSRATPRTRASSSARSRRGSSCSPSAATSGSVDLAAKLGKALPTLPKSDAPADRICYARDLWPRHHLAVSEGRIAEHRPGLIVWPRTTAEVAEVVRFCSAEGVPIAPFGAGSGVCGGVLPNERLVVLDLKRLDRLRWLDPEGPLLEVEAGALGVRLEEELNAKGFTIGHFPSSILCSTVGGWIAARGAGQCSGRYGKIEDMVASLECVVADGAVLRLHRRVHGPDLTPLMMGSEGVLGVVTSAVLRLHPVPVARAFGAYSFPSI